jgi:hypothetical protein
MPGVRAAMETTRIGRRRCSTERGLPVAGTITVG